MNVRLTTRAHRDIVNIVSFIEKDDPTAAATVARRIEASIHVISEMPTIGRTSARPNTREFVVRGLPLLIVYRLVADAIEVISIFHTSQNPDEK